MITAQPVTQATASLATASASAAPAPAAAPAASGRLDWLDAVKGIGIILVVIGHALGGLLDSRLGPGVVGFQVAFFIIYSFHMPLFFLLSGLTVGRRVTEAPRRFAEGMAIDVAWPYFLWATIQFTVIYLLGSIVNSPVESYWPTILQLPVRPVSQYWFLYVLFALHALALIGLPRLGAMALFLIALALHPLWQWDVMPTVPAAIIRNAPFYLLGLLLAPAGITALLVNRPLWARAALLPLLGVGAIAFGWWLAPQIHDGFRFADHATAPLVAAAWDRFMIPAALLGGAATIALASLVRGPLLALLTYLGRRSMPIFILHVLALAGVRILCLNLLKLDDPLLVLLLTIAAGLAFPLLAFAVAERLGITRPLGLGKAARTAATAR